MDSKKLTFDKYSFLKELGLQPENHGCYFGGKWCGSGDWLTSVNPSTDEPIAKVRQCSPEEYEAAIECMQKGKAKWMMTPIPIRGEIVREIGEAFRKYKKPLAQLISLEMGKILSEGEGEVQEVIDICDMACGLSRRLYGLVIPSERESHFMMEMWNPLGLIGVITAFNFPCAVLGWNLTIGLVCGDLIMWKGASTTSLITVACTKIVSEVLEKNGFEQGVLCTCIGPGRTIGERIINDHRLQLISFTGSTSIGQRISEIVHKRFGRTIMELGGNNAVIVMDDADLDMALKSILFGAIGTCGQRCTTIRRLLVHKDKYDELVNRMVKAYKTVKIGDPLNPENLCGPIHTKAAVKDYVEGLEEIKKQGGKILCGGNVLKDRPGHWVEPTLVAIDKTAPVLNIELFAPVMYIVKFDTLEEAIEINNGVPQGLSSSIFTKNIQNLFKWTGPLGSDCGMVNCNMGSSGAEIGGAFGGEKETGGGRESGSDAWKQYMRRSTCTINFGSTTKLAQGVKFDVE